MIKSKKNKKNKKNSNINSKKMPKNKKLFESRIIKILNKDYKEKHCHQCSKSHKTSFEKPICYSCFKSWKIYLTNILISLELS